MERKRLKDEQREAKARFRTFVDHASVVHDAGDLARKSRDLLKRYGLALALAGLALFLRGVLPFREGTSVYQLPLAAIVLGAWYGGRGPGLLASLICITAVGYWFVPPVNSFAIALDHVLPFSIFIGLCLFLSEFSAGRRRTEHALRASDERFRTLVQFSFDVYWETDAQHRFTRQEFADRLTDAPAPGSEIGKRRWEIPHLEPDEEAWRRHRATLDAHLPFRDFELARPAPDGGKRYVSVSGMPVFDEAGRFAGYRGVGRHITERKRAETELRARQELLDLAQQAARAVAFDWYIGARESENRWSPELEAMYGLEPGTFDGTYRGWKNLVHPDDWPAVKVAINRARESGDVAAEYRVIHKDGAVHWLRAKGRMFFDAKGQPERMVGFMIDVTDWWHAEEALRASEARFRTFVDRATDAFFLHDEHLVVVDVNRQACETLGYTREELVGMHPRDFDAGLDEPAIARLAEQAAAGQRVTFETRHRRKDGTVFPVEIHTGTFKQAGQLFYLALARDISERKLAEETLREKDNALEMARTELARVSRLTTLGELTTSIVHEVSQPLSAMIASAAAGTGWLAHEPPDIAQARSALDSIVADGERAREVIARIRALTKRQLPRKEWLDINHKILEVLALTKRELHSHDIVLRTQLDRALPRVAGDRVQLQQVLLNLIVNAIEAMNGVHDRPRELTIVSGQDGPNGLVVEVRDSGTGLDPERAERVFEAFYTTKAEGIGIGLSISRSIVEAHGGRLWASSNEPHGAVFRFSLPVAKEAL